MAHWAPWAAAQRAAQAVAVAVEVAAEGTGYRRTPHRRGTRRMRDHLGRLADAAKPEVAEG
jgi:hypothetical protein